MAATATAFERAGDKTSAAKLRALVRERLASASTLQGSAVHPVTSIAEYASAERAHARIPSSQSPLLSLAAAGPSDPGARVLDGEWPKAQVFFSKASLVQSGNSGIAFMLADFNGTWIDLSFKVEATKSGSSNIVWQGKVRELGWEGRHNMFEHNVPYDLPSTCGYTTNLTAQFTAAMYIGIWVPMGPNVGMPYSTADAANSDIATQTACPCGGGPSDPPPTNIETAPISGAEISGSNESQRAVRVTADGGVVIQRTLRHATDSSDATSHITPRGGAPAPTDQTPLDGIACGTNPGGGGGPGAGGGGPGWMICRYEDYYDASGTLMFSVFLGCTFQAG